MTETATPERIKVLLSAYACEPGKGSEPGVGWRWSNGLAGRVDLHVLTREDNRRAITQAIEGSDHSSPLRQVRFIYHDLPNPAAWLKRRRWLPTAAYYVLWQLSVCRKFKELAESVDVVHHLTFCNLLCPGFWNLQKSSLVIGPVGAPLVPQPYLPLFGPSAWIQKIRGGILGNFHRLPWLRRMLRRAAAIIPANSDAKMLLETRDFHCEDAMLDTGSPTIASIPTARDHPCTRFVSAGRLERRKGLELALRAFAMASPRLADWSFTIIGDGPDEERLRRMSEDLGISSHVVFTGLKSHPDTLEMLRGSDAFVFTSIRDTSGSVNLEAMANGLPVICIAHQGVGDITNDECALRITPTSIAATVHALRDAILKISADGEFARRLGKHAAIRANRDFSWDAKFDAMVDHYHRAARSMQSA